MGGHVKSGSGLDSLPTAEEETHEELGIEVRLIPCAGYPSYNKREEENFFNAEWRDVYVADVTTEMFTGIEFQDKEVIGLLLCPEPEVLNFLDENKNKNLAVASALQGSLRRCLETLRQESA